MTHVSRKAHLQWKRRNKQRNPCLRFGELTQTTASSRTFIQNAVEKELSRLKSMHQTMTLSQEQLAQVRSGRITGVSMGQMVPYNQVSFSAIHDPGAKVKPMKFEILKQRDPGDMDPVRYLFINPLR